MQEEWLFCPGESQSDSQPPSNLPGTWAVPVMPFMASTQLSQSQVFDPAPILEIQMSSLNRQATVEALPDLGADISVGGPTLLKQLNEHQDNFLKSNITPRAVSNTTMKPLPLGKLPITLKASLHRYTDIFHIIIPKCHYNGISCQGINNPAKTLPRASTNNYTTSHST